MGDDTILKPVITWQLNADAPGKVNAELGYITGGMKWSASYNLVSPEEGDTLDVIGWITMENNSGKTFTNARIKLLAGDVNKIQPFATGTNPLAYALAGGKIPASQVTEKAFDDFHLYSLPRETTLHDNETKQVEFIHASGVQSKRIYTYDSIRTVSLNLGWEINVEPFRNTPDLGFDTSTKIGVTREFKNSEANHLGLALPKGRVRFYRQDGEQLQFTGENTIDHTPRTN